MEYNAVIREYSGQSLKVCARAFLHDLSAVPKDWKIRYNDKSISHSVELRDLCCNQLNPLQIYKCSEAEFPVKIKTIDGESFEIRASVSDTVNIVKLKLFQICPKLPPQVQTLYCSGGVVNSLELKELLRFNLSLCKIYQGETAYVQGDLPELELLNNRVQIGGLDTSSVPSSLSVNPWGVMSTGMNFVGVCANPVCPSKEDPSRNQNVVLATTTPYGTFHLDLFRGRNTLNCPACSAVDADADIDEELFHITPKTFTVRNARSVIYLKYTGGKVSKVGLAYKRKGNSYTRSEAEGLLDQVEVTTVEPWRSPYCCVRCDTKILYKVHETQLVCGHVYHKWCVPSKLGGNKCKICCAVLIKDKICEALKVM